MREIGDASYERRVKESVRKGLGRSMHVTEIMVGEAGEIAALGLQRASALSAAPGGPSEALVYTYNIYC